MSPSKSYHEDIHTLELFSLYGIIIELWPLKFRKTLFQSCEQTSYYNPTYSHKSLHTIGHPETTL